MTTLTPRQLASAREAAFDAIYFDGAKTPHEVAHLMNWPIDLARRAVSALAEQRRIETQGRRLHASEPGSPMPFRIRRKLFREMYEDLPSPLLTVPAATAGNGGAS